MDNQAELFPAMEYVDLSFGMTARSTRRKQPPKKSDRFYKNNRLQYPKPKAGLKDYATVYKFS